MRRCLPWTAFLLLAFCLVSCTAFLDFKPGRDADTPDDGRDIDADPDRADEADAADRADGPAPDRDEGREDGGEGEIAPDILEVPDVPPDDGVETDAMEECLPPSCVLSGSCYPETTTHPSNICRYCHVGSWIPRPDGFECGTGNMCCSGECEVDAECCTALQCPEACMGTAAPCSTYLSDPAPCVRQAGCNATGPCGDIGRSCSYVLEGSCAGCGCEWTGSACQGTFTMACSQWDDQYQSCINCGCSWGSSWSCDGTAVTCDSYVEEFYCSQQGGCSWAHEPCTDHQCGS